MSAISPNWFDTDKIFALDAGWYFGSRDGLHIGPYEDFKLARMTADRVGGKLRALHTDQDQLSYLREFLRKERVAVGALPRFLDAPASPNIAESGEASVRAGEGDKVWYRSGRFFRIDNVWFFSTREGIDVGPFATEREARRHERRLVAMLSKIDSAEEAHRAIYEYNQRPSAGFWVRKPKR